ncbi:hypothetical protein V8E36_008988 [Tilletia maclaganii]
MTPPHSNTTITHCEKSTVRAQLLQQAVTAAEAEPLIRFLAWQRNIEDLLPVGPLIPSAFRPDQKLCCECPSPSSSYDVQLLRFEGPVVKTIKTCKTHLVKTLLLAGLFPASPIIPRIAIDMALIRSYESLSDWSNLTVFGFSNAILQMWGAMTYNDGLRKLLRSASIWRSALRYKDAQESGPRSWKPQRPLVHEDHLDLTFDDLVERCPACFYRLSEGIREESKYRLPNNYPQVLFAIDGNFAQRRLANIDHVQRSPVPPTYFISAAQVKETRIEMYGTEPATQSDEPPTWHACASNVLAADEQAAKGAPGICDITGLMGLCCRHDVPLAFCDIDSPGEQHHYAIALLKQVLKALPDTVKRVGVLYDIGCRFPAKASLDTILTVKVDWAVSVFHVFGNSSACQILYSPRNLKGFGWSDGEGMERIWLQLSPLVESARSMSHGDRRHVLEQRLDHQSRQARANLMTNTEARVRSLEAVKSQARAVLSARTTKALVLPRYSQTLRDYSRWSPPPWLSGLNEAVCFTLFTLAEARRSKVAEPLPAEDRLPPLQRLCIQLLSRLASVRIGQQQIQGRHNKGRHGTRMMENISKSLKAAKKAARALLAKVNQAAALVDRPSDEVFVPLEANELFTDKAYEWVALQTLQFSDWLSNLVIEAALNAFQQLHRVAEEIKRSKVESDAALLWLKRRFDSAFAVDTPEPLPVQQRLIRIYLAWFPHRRRRLLAPHHQRRYPYDLPRLAEAMKDAASKAYVIELAEPERNLVEEASRLLNENERNLVDEVSRLRLSSLTTSGTSTLGEHLQLSTHG